MASHRMRGMMAPSDPPDATGAAVRNFLLRRSAGNDDAPAPGGSVRPARADMDVAFAWDVAGSMADDPEILRLRAEALAAPVDPVGDNPRPPRFLRRSALAATGAMAAAICAYFAWPALSPRIMANGPPQIATVAPTDAIPIVSAGGTRRMVTLPDGTQVVLDARSDMRVAFNDGERRIFLMKGRAYFDVHHEARPFIVNSGGGETIDLGTRFVIDTDAGRTMVSLVEGKVMVRPEAASDPVPLKPGQSIRYAGKRQTAVLAQIDGDPLDWTTGRLMFDETPLDDAARILSRYAAAPIIVDPAVATRDRRVTGVFMTRDNAGFAATLAEALDLHVQTASDGSQRLTVR